MLGHIQILAAKPFKLSHIADARPQIAICKDTIGPSRTNVHPLLRTRQYIMLGHYLSIRLDNTASDYPNNTQLKLHSFKRIASARIQNELSVFSRSSPIAYRH